MSTDPAIVFEWDGDTPLTEDIPRPVPAAEVLPDWFKHLPTKNDGKTTVKLCASFSDALRMGWIIPFPYDFSYSRGADSLSCVVPEDTGEVTEYGLSSPEFSGNTSFRAPEFKLTNPWKIHTPDGYSTLITYPLNRSETGVKPYSVFVDTDTHDGPINVLASGTQPQAHVKKGTPFIHVIPIRRETLMPEFDITSESESPDLWEMWENGHEAAGVANGYYRRFCWEPKPAKNNTDLTNVDGDFTSTDDRINELTGTPEAVDNPLHIPKVIAADEDYDVFPEPFSNGGVIPTWIKNPDELASDGDEEHKLCEWARNAMDLGWNFPVPADTRLDIRSDGVELASRFEGEFKRGLSITSAPATNHSTKQVGDHPDQPSIVKFLSPWFTLTPPGYSVLGVEPVNHMQQTVQSYAGLVDADRFLLDGNLLGKTVPSEGQFEIPGGEPGMMEIPIHRDSMLTESYIIDSA